MGHWILWFFWLTPLPPPTQNQKKCETQLLFNYLIFYYISFGCWITDCSLMVQGLFLHLIRCYKLVPKSSHGSLVRKGISFSFSKFCTLCKRWIESRFGILYRSSEFERICRNSNCRLWVTKQGRIKAPPTRNGPNTGSLAPGVRRRVNKKWNNS